MKKSTLNKLRANLDKALEPPRTTTPPKDDNSEAIARRYAVAEALTSARGTENVPGTENAATPVQNVPGTENVPRIKSVPHKGHLRLANEFLYDIMPCLKPSDGYVLLYLIARTHGFRQQSVTVTLDAIAKACCISRSQARVNVNSLVKKGYVKHIGTDSSNRNPQLRGLILEVLQPPGPGSESVPRPDNVPRPESTPIKEHTLKENTQTQESVRVGSRFSLKECRQYADSLKSEGIQNPGGYATKIHRTGEADELIDRFLSPPPPAVDSSQCPDCHGSGWMYPNGKDNGVTRCKHERLLATSS